MIEICLENYKTDKYHDLILAISNLQLAIAELEKKKPSLDKIDHRVREAHRLAMQQGEVLFEKVQADSNTQQQKKTPNDDDNATT